MMKKRIKNTILLVVFCFIAGMAFQFNNADAKSKIKVNGASYAPYFEIAGSEAFCVDSQAKHPHNGIEYSDSKTTDYKKLDKVFINRYTESGNAQAMVYAVWAVMDAKDYSSEAEMTGCLDAYQSLMKDVDNAEDYVVEYTIYSTTETSASGKAYQRVISAKVSKKQEPTPEPTVEPTPEPTKEPETTPDPTDEPESTPEPTPETTNTPEPEVTPEVTPAPEVTPTVVPTGSSIIIPTPLEEEDPEIPNDEPDPEDSSLEMEELPDPTPSEERIIPQTGLSVAAVIAVIVVFAIVLFKRLGRKYEDAE